MIVCYINHYLFDYLIEQCKSLYHPSGSNKNVLLFSLLYYFNCDISFSIATQDKYHILPIFKIVEMLSSGNIIEKEDSSGYFFSFSEPILWVFCQWSLSQKPGIKIHRGM